MRVLVLALVFTFIYAVESTAQVTIIQSSDIQTLLDKEKSINKSTTTVRGWSIQILSSDDRTKVTELKTTFLNTYPNIAVDWDYEAPYYKLRAGAFRTKAEATRLLYKLREQFPDAYTVKNNNISPIDLL